MSEPPTTCSRIESLPDELLLKIVSYLDVDPPSIKRFADEPSVDFTTCTEQPLKIFSTLSHRLRRFILPTLFRCARIRLGEEKRWVMTSDALGDYLRLYLDRLSRHERQVFLRLNSFSSQCAMADPFATPRRVHSPDIEPIESEDSVLRTRADKYWLPYLSKEHGAFKQFVISNNLGRRIQSLVVYTNQTYANHLEVKLERVAWDASRLMWNTIYSYLDPTRLVVAAPPPTVGVLLECPPRTPDDWAFDMHCHYLELIQERPTSVGHTNQRSKELLLYRLRPWCHISYNEGPSLNAYRTYEYHWRRPYRVLPLILINLKECEDWSGKHSLRSFSFTGIFPFCSTVLLNINCLETFKNLQSIYLQLAPDPDSKILDDPEKTKGVMHNDLWLEWNETYRKIATGIHPTNHSLRISSSDYRSTKLAQELDEKFNEHTGWQSFGNGTWSWTGIPNRE